MTARMFDKQLELRDLASAPRTTTGADAAFALPTDKAGTFKAVFVVTAADRGDANETYTFGIEADTASGFPSAVTVASLPAITDKGIYEVPLSAELIQEHEPGATHIRCKATLAGTTPSITYGCFLVPTP